MRRLRSDPAALPPSVLDALLAARHGDPFSVLGMHVVDGALTVRCVQPGAERVHVVRADDGRDCGALVRLGGPVFGACLGDVEAPFHYRLRVWRGDAVTELVDPYAMPPVLGELDCHLLAEGAHWRLYQHLGAHRRRLAGIDGVAFAVWAPNARRVSVVGDFNGWDARVHPMRRRPECGVWELFVPGLGAGELYKYRLLGADGVDRDKADPCAQRSEAPPGTASRVDEAATMVWHDQAWMAGRGRHQGADAPIAIYEVHAGSWRRDGGAVDFDRLADTLVPYVQSLGFTHIELLPVTEHPFGGSWGYQPTGLFAPSARWGPPMALRRFVDRCHDAGIGVLLDWVPAHFPDDPHGLARFDGTCLYEHADSRRGRYPGWNTLAYNFGRREVANLLIASALHWLREYHVDGLRVDAVASMLYLDYDRGPGQWLPNVHGGREHLEAIAFLRRFNHVVHEVAPAGAITIAEESTAWPGVTRPVHLGGLGFDCKWNMGWMNDTRSYMARDPVHRSYHHDQLTFGLLYAHSERFVLPLSHDEVVHGKGSLLARMPGDAWQQRANLRLYLAFQYTQPGHKLLFMGGEFGQWREWDHDGELDWALLDDPAHAGIQQLLGDLNRLYRGEPALHRRDCEPDGFAWIDCSDHAHSVLAWRRRGGPGDAELLVVCNFTPVPHHGYRVGAAGPGVYRECLNTDAHAYGGSGCGNLGAVGADARPWHGLPYSLSLTLPPLAALVLRAPA